MNIYEPLLSRSKPAIMAMGTLLVIVIGVIDYFTGYDLSFSTFYLIPIFYVTWTTGRGMGVVISLLSALAWYLADWKSGHFYIRQFIPFWNAGLRLSFFLIVVFTLSALKSALEREKQLARRDYVTGLANSKAFFESMENEIQQSRRYNHPLAVAFMDCDNFKDVNDQFGHQTGNVLLQVVADAIRRGIRATDVAARVGGDEFAIILPETNAEQARIVIERLQTSISKAMEERKWPVTTSIGVAMFDAPHGTPDDLMRKADTLMYESKQAGKNRITFKTMD